jgi:hypothetical protein
VELFVVRKSRRTLSESVFNAPFAAIDLLDQSGTVDFLEFCTIMGKCSDAFRSARGNRGFVRLGACRLLLLINQERWKMLQRQQRQP